MELYSSQNETTFLQLFFFPPFAPRPLKSFAWRQRLRKWSITCSRGETKEALKCTRHAAIYGTRRVAPQGNEGAGWYHSEATLSSLRDHGDQGRLSEKEKQHARLLVRLTGGSEETQASGCYVVIFCMQVILYVWMSFCSCYVHDQRQTKFLYFTYISILIIPNIQFDFLTSAEQLAAITGT